MIVADASAVVAALVAAGPVGQWAAGVLAIEPITAPHLLPAEVANILRRSNFSGDLTDDTAALAHADLIDLSAHLLPYEPLAARVWELRANVTSHDAWYVAMAEELDVALLTLDHRVVAAPGPTRWFLVPPSSGSR